MKKFTFSLQRVLDYKEQIEESLRSQHAQAVRKVMDKQQEIDKLEAQFNSYKDGINDLKTGAVSIFKLREYENYLSYLTNSIAKAKQELSELKMLEEKAREKVIEAKKDTSSIQKLKDKKKSEYDKMAAKKQEQEIEEFVSNRAGSRSC